MHAARPGSPRFRASKRLRSSRNIPVAELPGGTRALFVVSHHPVDESIRKLFHRGNIAQRMSPLCVDHRLIDLVQRQVGPTHRANNSRAEQNQNRYLSGALEPRCNATLVKESVCPINALPPSKSEGAALAATDRRRAVRATNHKTARFMRERRAPRSVGFWFIRKPARALHAVRLAQIHVEHRAPRCARSRICCDKDKRQERFRPRRDSRRRRTAAAAAVRWLHA